MTYDNLKAWAIRARITGYLPQLFNRRRMKILMIDGIPLNILLEEKMLQVIGFKNFFETQNWDSALEIIHREKLNLITTSIEHYFDVDFKETIRKIREINKTVTIIAISSWNSQRDIERAMGFGFDGYITKPPIINNGRTT